MTAGTTGTAATTTKATLRDVAEHAGVSAMTVSNVVNGRAGKVSAATAERVRAAIAALGYVPNAQARSLAGSSSRILGLVYGAPAGSSPLSLPHESLFVGACERAARQAGYALMLCGATDLADLEGRLRGWGVAGALVMASFSTPPARFLDAVDLPVVFVDTYEDLDDPRVVSVGIDDRAGSRLVGARLAGLGHRRVLLAGPDESCSAVVRERALGLAEGLEGDSGCADGGAAGRAGARLERVVAQVGFEDGVSLGARIAALPAGQRPTAVFASGDVLGLGVVAGLRRAGLRVPGDVSVVAFDGFELSGYVEPALTSVSQSVPDKAEVAVARLRALVEAEDGAGRETEAQEGGRAPGEGAGRRTVLPVSWRAGGTLATPPPGAGA